MRVGHARLCLTLTAAVALFFSLQISGQNAQAPPAPSPASPQVVCDFIAGRMKSILPQEPTLCSAKQGKSPKYYYVNVFSPTNVLEGDMRRAWSSALFQTLEELPKDKSLNGACSEEPICFISISDAYTAQHSWHYETIASKDDLSIIRGTSDKQHGDQFSDRWYITWWQNLIAFKQSDTPGSKENATQLARSACEHYAAALRETHGIEFAKRQGDRLVKEGGTLVGHVDYPGDLALPSCSVMLATDKTIYFVLDFADFLTPSLFANTSELLPTVGEMLDNTGYDGQVILRTPWVDTDKGPVRVYRTLLLRGIEFAFEERQSGLRDEFDAQELLMSYFSTAGQTTQDRLFGDPKDKFVLRNAAVISYLAGSNNTVTIDTTDGAEWTVSREAFDRCNLTLGREIQVSTELISGNTVRLDGPPTLTTLNEGPQCTVPAAFVKGW